MRATTSSSRQQLDRCERELAEVALEDRGSSCELEISRGQESCRRGQSDPVDYYERYGLIPIHRDVDSWVYVSEDPQLAIAMEEVVNTFSPALSVELLLYNILGSNNDSATCLVRYLINYYSSNHVCEHIKTTLRNMIRWSVLAGFVPCVFLPWKKVRALGLGLSGKATVTNLISCNPVVHKDAYRTLGCSDDNGDDGVDGGDRSKRRRLERHKRPWRSGHTAIGEHTGRGGRCKQRQRQHIEEPCLRTAQDGFSPPEAASEAVQEREAHERALHSVLDVPPEQLAATLKLLMSNSVPDTLVSVLCRIVQVWVEQDVMPKRDPIKETEMKIALVTLWGVMKTFEHGRCPVVPECNAWTCLAFYDTKTDLVTAAVDGVLYRHISVWDGCWARGSNVSSLAKRAHPTVKSWATLFHKTIQGLTTASNRHVYTSTGVNGSSLAHLADLILSSRGEQQRAGLSVAGNAFGKPLLDNLSRFLASDQQPDMFGLNMADLPDVFLRSGVGTTVSEHKSASVSHSLSKMMASMISEGKEVLLVRQFLGEVTRRPRLALEQLKSECEDRRLLQMAESIVKHLEQADGEGRDSDSAEPVTELGSDVKLVCSYPSSVSVAHLEETLSMWTNFWRSALSGFSQFNRRHNTIQYNNNRDTVRDLESGSPVHIFHCMLVTLLNTSGVTFADSLSGRRPDASLTVNDIMLTRDSLHPTAYGLLLANKLGLRPSDVKCKEGEPEPEREPQVEPEREKGAIEAEKSICVQNNV
ncbi:hypothetical protein D5F01_LYC23952 [Larimichthys crocea]|uniref:Uncharacterized protein n=2 Tax=Larimichthys crocea TaxID=215358 RepID=A0A6G0HFK6_LARCR|nr:hypothetical protein D5F01_LYC23952 [Larimichthys crocea]